MARTPLRFGGTETFPAAPATVFAQLTDLDALATQIPDLVSAERSGPRRLDCVVRPGVSFLRGTMRLAIEVVDAVPAERAAMYIDARGIGTTMRIESRLTLAPVGEGTELTWEAHVPELTGLVATVSPALISAAAERVIRHAWSQLRARLGGQQPD